MRPDTSLVSIMTVNNEIGVLQPVHEIGKLCRSRKVTMAVLGSAEKKFVGLVESDFSRPFPFNLNILGSESGDWIIK